MLFPEVYFLNAEENHVVILKCKRCKKEFVPSRVLLRSSNSINSWPGKACTTSN